MPTGIVLSTPRFERIIENLVLLEEEYPQILEQYYPEYTREREDFLEWITGYIQKLNQAVQGISVKDGAPDGFPFAILGSQVEIEDMEDSTLSRYRIVCPSKRSLDQGCISLLSPIGRALLLKEENDVVAVETPGGIYRYRIRSITLD